MSLFQWEQNPWGQEVLVRISWNLFWLAVVGAALFIIGHLVFRSKHKEVEPEVPASAGADIPEKVTRHPLASRLFHWAMAASVITLLVTGFFPVIGIQFDWVTIHWIAGIVFVGTIVFHVIHSIGWMDIRSVWVSGADWAEFKQEVRHAMGTGEAPPKPGKYPVDQRLFHNLVALAGFGVLLTGLLMMVRIQNPIFGHNPYLFSDSTWGIIYVIHGLASVGLVGMTMAHVYFAVLPEKRWMTISMIAGWITKKDFLTHHDPNRWVVTEKASE